MNIIFFGNGGRSLPCLEILKGLDHHIQVIVAHPENESKWYTSLAKSAAEMKIPIYSPERPNSKPFEKQIKAYNSDLFILAGYGKILSNNIIELPRKMCINLHAGKLPEYRGSSPLNWALINGEDCFSLSIIQLTKRIDAGPVLFEKTFSIEENTTIVDLHKIANMEFPRMLNTTIEQLDNNTFRARTQNESEASYYPLRFPDDGFILWDTLSANQIHNRIRALTEPYPCAFSFFKGEKVKFLSSHIHTNKFCGEPGRIYQNDKGDLLISAKDGALWITEAIFEESGLPLSTKVKRYQSLSTLQEVALNFYRK